MEVNKEEALRCLHIAQRHRTASNLPSALKFAKKSVSLYATPEGETLVTIVEKELLVSSSNGSANGSGSGTSTPNAEASGSGSGSGARASGVEEHVSSAHKRPGHSSAAPSGSAAGTSADKGKKREYTAKQMEVVKRVKSCKHHEYYEILAVEKTCEENDVKRAYKKLALALHPDKNGYPGADEAFKMVSKAFQILSDPNLRAAFDANPHSDPTQRGGGGGGGGGMYRGGGGMPPGFGGGNGMYTEINPEDLFNAFFGGGGFGGGGFGQPNVFTFGGPGGFQAHFGGPARRPRAGTAGAGGGANNSSPIIALLPVLILCAFALLGSLPSLLWPNTPDPSYAFEASRTHDLGRRTWNWGVPYFVNADEWGKSELWMSVPEGRRAEDRAALFSGKVKGFERGVENVYAQRLRNECERFAEAKERRVAQEAGFFGIGADYDKIRDIRAEKSPACEQLKQWGLLRAQGQNFF